MYLTDVKKGGETVFPNAEVCHYFWDHLAFPGTASYSHPMHSFREDIYNTRMKRGPSAQDLAWQVAFISMWNSSSDPDYTCACPKTSVCSSLAVKPRKGDALLFFSLHINATTDPSSLHGSCPVIEGEKWSATKWIHVRSFDNPPIVRMDVRCSDDNELCSKWAAVGECYRNPKYMIGTKDTLGFCRKSCGICDAWNSHLSELYMWSAVLACCLFPLPFLFYLGCTLQNQVDLLLLTCSLTAEHLDIKLFF